MDIAANTYQRILARQYPEADFLSAERLTGGVSADVYRIDYVERDDTTAIVVRIHGANHNGVNAKLEFDLLSAVCQFGIPAPRPVSVDTSGEIIPEPYLLIEFISGSTQVEGVALPQVLHEMAQQLRRIHRPVPDTFPVLPGRTEAFPDAYEWLKDERWVDLVALVQTIETSFSGEPVLLHGDYWPENIMWQDDRIVAVLDWEDAATGDPLSDLACCCLELSYLHGEEVTEQFLAAYGAEIDRVRFSLWQIHVASAAAAYMGNWGLPASREAHMRRIAIASIEQAWDRLKG